MNKKKVKQNKIKPLLVRLTEDNHKVIQARALEKDLAMSTYVRMVVLGGIKRQQTGEYALDFKLVKIGHTNLS